MQAVLFSFKRKLLASHMQIFLKLLSVESHIYYIKQLLLLAFEKYIERLAKIETAKSNK